MFFMVAYRITYIMAKKEGKIILYMDNFVIMTDMSEMDDVYYIC